MTLRGQGAVYIAILVATLGCGLEYRAEKDPRWLPGWISDFWQDCVVAPCPPPTGSRGVRLSGVCRARRCPTAWTGSPCTKPNRSGGIYWRTLRLTVPQHWHTRFLPVLYWSRDRFNSLCWCRGPSDVSDLQLVQVSVLTQMGMLINLGRRLTKFLRCVLIH